MTETMFLKYGLGPSFALVCLLLLSGLHLLARRRPKLNHSLTFHAAQIGLACSLVLLIQQSALQAIHTYSWGYLSPRAVKFLALLAIMLIVMQQLFLLINRLQKDQIQRGKDPTSTRLIGRLFKATIFVVLMLLFGEHFGMSLSGLLTFGGIGGLAIGLAGKDILSNFFSGVMLYFDRPFNIGDWVRSPDRNIEGTVTEIGWRLTKITTFDQRPLYVPNSIFSTISVENPGRMTNRRINTEIGLRYEDAGKVRAIVNDIRTMLHQNAQIDTQQTVLVNFNAFADSSLNIMVYCFTKTVRWAEWLDVQQEVYLAIIDIVQKHGADFAFPSRTVYFDPAAATNPPANAG